MLNFFFFQYVDEEVKETPTTKDTAISIKTELADHSEASTPNSPVTPREESEPKPVLSTTSSTAEHDVLPDVGNAISENSVSAPDTVCTTSTVDTTLLGKDFNNSLTECMVEINIAVGSGRNTPSPCPSTAGRYLKVQLLVLVLIIPQ